MEMKKLNNNEYKLLRNMSISLGNLTLGISSCGASMFYYGYRTPTNVVMIGASIGATFCLYKLARDYHINAKYLEEKELKK